MAWVALAQEIWMDWVWVMAFATWCLDKGGRAGLGLWGAVGDVIVVYCERIQALAER